MQAYLALHASGEFLIVQKRTRNRWWKGRLGNAGIVNQANQFAFPGGRVEDGEEVAAAALREFKEESGWSIPQSMISSLSVVLSNQQYALVECEVSSQYMQQVITAVQSNISPAPGAPEQPTGGVVDWEFQSVQLVRAANLANFLGVRQAVAAADQAAVNARPPYSQDIDWYAQMALALADF